MSLAVGSCRQVGFDFVLRIRNEVEVKLEGYIIWSDVTSRNYRSELQVGR